MKDYLARYDAIFAPRSSTFCGKVGMGRGAFMRPVVSLKIIDEKVWLQADNTDLRIAERLEVAGISKADIAPGLHPPRVRPNTEYAVA